jgi:hypothetical protein
MHENELNTTTKLSKITNIYIMSKITHQSTVTQNIEENYSNL